MLPDLPPLILLCDRLESGPWRGRTMKRTRFAEEQVIGILKEAEAGAKTGEPAPSS